MIFWTQSPLDSDSGLGFCKKVPYEAWNHGNWILPLVLMLPLGVELIYQASSVSAFIWTLMSGPNGTSSPVLCIAYTLQYIHQDRSLIILEAQIALGLCFPKPMASGSLSMCSCLDAKETGFFRTYMEWFLVKWWAQWGACNSVLTH